MSHPEPEAVELEFAEDTPLNVESLKKNLIYSKFVVKKDYFIKHLQGKIAKLNYNCRYLDLKYNDYLKKFNNLSIYVIILSSILTLIEAFTELYDINDLENKYIKSSIKTLPLIVSTIVSVLAALVRFLKYQEHMERLGITTEKAIVAISKIKKI